MVYKSADELIYTDTMRERKAIMADRASAFIVLPGGDWHSGGGTGDNHPAPSGIPHKAYRRP